MKRLKTFNKIRSYLDWPKVKKGEILIVPSDNRLIENPPTLGKDGWPEWYKSSKIAKPGTIVSCKGIQDYLSIGLTVPLWCDIEVFQMGMDDVRGRTSDPAFNVDHFGGQMAEGCPISHGRDLDEAGFPKIVSPFLYKTAPGYSMLVLPIAYEPDERYQVLPAIVHTDFYHNINVVLRVMTKETFVIKAGTPIYQLIPFKRSDTIGKVIFGDAEIYETGKFRGLSYGGIGKFSMKGLYRKHQRDADADL